MCLSTRVKLYLCFCACYLWPWLGDPPLATQVTCYTLCIVPVLWMTLSVPTIASTAPATQVKRTLKMTHQGQHWFGTTKLAQADSHTVKISVCPRLFVASFPYFNGTGSVYVCICVNRRNNEAWTRIAVRDIFTVQSQGGCSRSE